MLSICNLKYQFSGVFACACTCTCLFNRWSLICSWTQFLLQFWSQMESYFLYKINIEPIHWIWFSSCPIPFVTRTVERIKFIQCSTTTEEDWDRNILKRFNPFSIMIFARCIVVLCIHNENLSLPRAVIDVSYFVVSCSVVNMVSPQKSLLLHFWPWVAILSLQFLHFPELSTMDLHLQIDIYL